MPNNVTVRCRGLYTLPNYLGSDIPDGALAQADNIVIDRDGIAEPRRGLNFYGGSFSTLGIRAKQLLTYKGRILRHWTNTLEYDSDGAGTFTSLSSSVTEPTSGIRIKYVEANGNFYFTTSTGIQKISSSSASGVPSAGVTPAGGVKALDGAASLNSQTGFFTQDSQAAYRIVWGITDANNNVILGSPSPFITISNPQTNLMINDFNTLVADLTKVASADNTQALSDTTYNQLKISGNSSPLVLYNNLLSLASQDNNKLDNDLSLTGVSITTTAGSAAATTASTTNIQPGMILSGNNNLANVTTLALTTIAQSDLASVANTSGLVSGTLLTSNPNIPENTLIAAITPGAVINVLPGSSYVSTATTGDYFDIQSAITTYRFWFSVGSATAPSSAGVTLTPVVILSTDSSTSVATKLTTAINGATAFTTTTNSNIISITNNGINSPVSHVANTSFTLTSTNLFLTTVATVSGTQTTLAASSTVVLTTTAGSTSATVPSTAGLVAGIILSGNSSLASGTSISSITNSTTLVLSNPAVSNGTSLTGVANTTVVSIVNPTTFIMSSTASASGSAATNFTSTTFQNIATPSSPDSPATTQELNNIQAYFDNIIGALNTINGISVTGKSAIGGAFLNSTQSATVNLTFTIPANITTSHFYQIYRSPLALSSGQSTLSDVSPSDELQLVFENNPTSSEISAKSITYHDIVPETFRESGANLYTNANSGEGILQANEIPPLAKDVALFRTCTFYANTQSLQSLEVDMLTAIGLNTKTFTITQGSTVNTYTFVTNAYQITNIQCVAGSAFTSSGTADYFDIFNANNTITYRVWFKTGTTVAPSGVGVTLIECDVLNTDSSTIVAGKLRDSLNSIIDFFASASTSIVTVTNQSVGYTNNPVSHVSSGSFTLTVTTSGAGERAATKTVGVSIASTPSQEIDETARSLCRVINKNASEVVYAYYISGANDVPGQMNFQAKSLGATAFTFTSSLGSAFNPTLPASGVTVISNNEVAPNRLYYSKTQQPEAVPSVNFQDVGPKDKQIVRVLPLRDSVFILSQDGVYRLTGQTPATFQILLFDNTTKIIAPDSAVVLNNQIFCLSDQGVVTISDTGVSVLSRPIENLVLPLFQYSNFASATFAVGYSTDRAYLLWTISSPTDTVATQCFRYNTFTNTWVRWVNTKTCGVVPPEVNTLYLGAGDTNFIEKERKNFNRQDHADRQFDLTLISVNGTALSVDSSSGVSSGDALIQTQYLTISQFNRLLDKLDRDPVVGYKNYLSTLKANAGVNIRTSLTTLASKLDTDTGINDSGFSAAISGFSSSFSDCQLAFNVIVNRLNASARGIFTNYTVSSGTVMYEVPIVSVSSINISVLYSLPFIIGTITSYQHFVSKVTWVPHAFGDPSMLKHVSEGTIMLQNKAFGKASAAYSSDLSTGLESIVINGEGTGAWGSFSFGNVSFGGQGTSTPFRTLIPTKKQRSRFLNCQFTHASALEQYALFGLSYTFNPVSNKAYR